MFGLPVRSPTWQGEQNGVRFAPDGYWLLSTGDLARRGQTLTAIWLKGYSEDKLSRGGSHGCRRKTAGQEMKRTITHFMWGYQQHFRFHLEYTSRQLLSALGVALEPEGILVGVRAPEISEGFPACVEPEDGKWELTLFSECLARVEEIYANHPDQDIFYGDEPSMRDKPEWIRRKSVRQAVEEALAPYDEENGVRSFCGAPTRVGRYYVVPVLQVSRAAFDVLPALPGPLCFMEWTSSTGLVEALLLEILADASEALGEKEPGRGLDFFSPDPPAILRRAARGFCRAVSLLVRDIMLQDLFDTLNGVSALKYEGTETKGEMVFAPDDCAAVARRMVFASPIPLAPSRLVRKLVEMSGDGLAILCSSSKGLSGLATVEYTVEAPVFRVVFTGHYCWELYFNDCLLLRSSFGVPGIPRPRLSETAFVSNSRRVIPGMDEEQSHRLWQAVSAAMEQQHGTLFVVSDAAESEARRLGSQSLPVEPIPLTPRLVQRLTGIDGAILADRDSVCHAVGVILDGLATDAGDPSRGARYNSAVRYAGTADAATLCIVVSEDGDVDMIPTLRPQTDRTELEARVEALRGLTYENYHDTRNWLDRHRFYLSVEQCLTVNQELERLYAEVMSAGELWVVLSPFEPNPGMDPSYFLDEDPE